jgi:hypothetical protein
MKIILRLGLLAAVVAAGVWLWTVLFPAPEKVIRRRLAAVARDTTFAAGENSLAQLARAQKLAGFFSPNVAVNLETPRRFQQSFTDRDEIVQAIMAARAAVSGLKVEFLDVSVTVGQDKQSAVADLTAKVQVAGDKDFNVQAMRITLQKTGGEWFITRVETVRTLS